MLSAVVVMDSRLSLCPSTTIGAVHFRLALILLRGHGGVHYRYVIVVSFDDCVDVINWNHSLCRIVRCASAPDLWASIRLICGMSFASAFGAVHFLEMLRYVSLWADSRSPEPPTFGAPLTLHVPIELRLCSVPILSAAVKPAKCASATSIGLGICC